MIDEEVKRIFDDAAKKCEEILTEHADIVRTSAEYLLEHESMTGEQFKYLIQHGRVPSPDELETKDEQPEEPAIMQEIRAQALEDARRVEMEEKNLTQQEAWQNPFEDEGHDDSQKKDQ